MHIYIYIYFVVVIIPQLLDRGKTLEENLEKLEQERQRSEELLYRMMPKAVADELRDGRKAVETCKVLWRRFNSTFVCFADD